MTTTENEKYNSRIGQIIEGRFEITDFIDVGGSSVVYRATDLTNGNTVALKILKFDPVTDTEDLPALRRMILESEAIFAIDNPHVVKIHHISVNTNVKYIAMEFLCGTSLKSFCTDENGKARILPQHLALDITAQVLSALDAAHTRGIIHRDIKPQNIMICEDGRVVVTDFGIAKFEESVGATMIGKIVGTPLYISPEQAKGEVLDHRADLYSTGITLYQMLTGTVPFDSDEGGQTGSLAILNMHIHQLPKSPRSFVPEISLGAEQIILHALEKSPSQRFESAAHMKRVIEELMLQPDRIFPSDFDLNPISASQRRRALKITMLSAVAAIFIISAIAVLCIVLSLNKIWNTPIDLPSDFNNYNNNYKNETTQAQNNFDNQSAQSLNDTDFDDDGITPIEQSFVFIPELTGMSCESALFMIDGTGLEIEIKYSRSESVSPGFVIYQSLLSGTQTRAGTIIEIVVSSGKK